jgi:hypothetical protein
MKFIAFVAVMLLAATTAPSAAQMKVEKWGGTPVYVIMVKFKAGKIARVDEIESKYFGPAAAKVGYGTPTIVHFVAGEWDREYIFPMADGMAGLTYKTSDRDIAFMTAIGKIAGNPADAQKISDEWDAAVDHSTSYIGFSDTK